MVSHIQNLFVHYPKMLEEKIWVALNDSQKKVAVLAAVIFGMIAVAYMIYKCSERMDINAKKLEQEQDDDIEIKQESDPENKDEFPVIYSNAAVLKIEDYDNWKPVSANSLDLRLATFINEDKVNEIISKKANEMGKKLEAVYTQASYISIAGYQALVAHCPHIKVLNLYGAQKIDDKALKVIAGLKELEELNLAEARKVNWTESRGTGFDEITDNGVAEILNQCKHLKSLDLSYTQITAKTLDLIALHPTLCFVRVFNCDKLTPDDIVNFTKKCPYITLKTDSIDDVLPEFFKLEIALKPRYYQIIDTPIGQKPALRPGISVEEEELIDPMVFIDFDHEKNLC